MNTDTVIINGIEYVPKVVPEPAKVGRWKPDGMEKFWWLNNGEIISSFWDDGNSLHVTRFKFGNVYQTEELAIRARDKQMLLVELQDYADEKNKGEELSKSCYRLVKQNDMWDWTCTSNNNFGTVKFNNIKDVNDAVGYFGIRLDLLL